MARNLGTIKDFLADLPTIVTADLLAEKMDVDIEAVYMRKYRQKNTDRQLLPHQFGVTRRLKYHKSDVINWWIDWFSTEHSIEINQFLKMPAKRGRPRNTLNSDINISY